MANLPVVCIFGLQNVELQSCGPIPHFETQGMDCRCYLSDDDLKVILAKDRPQAIVSFGGKPDEFPRLLAAPFHVRRMWLHFSDTKDMARKGHMAFMCFLHNALAPRNDVPLVSVFTPLHRTGERMMRPFNSLQAQTYSDWEWVVVDDSHDDDETFRRMAELAEREPRIRLYKGCAHSGVIGNVKRTACEMARGEILVELDHDDELRPNAIEWLVSAYRRHPEVGFVYTDFAECNENREPVTYGPGWGLGYGSYRQESHDGVEYMVVNSPNINAKTIRHIVAAPNHIRSWRKSVYFEVGGHNAGLHVADDYELMIRTFLGTRMGHIPRMAYIQYRNQTGNTMFVRNKEIQRLVRYVSCWYDVKIHERLLELGVDDFVWKDGETTFNKLQPTENPEEESHCTVKIES